MKKIAITIAFIIVTLNAYGHTTVDVYQGTEKPEIELTDEQKEEKRLKKNNDYETREFNESMHIKSLLIKLIKTSTSDIIENEIDKDIGRIIGNVIPEYYKRLLSAGMTKDQAFKFIFGTLDQTDNYLNEILKDR